jgi:hypothetical protein
MPSNITRGNIEGLIAMTVNFNPTSMIGLSCIPQTVSVPGALTTDVVLSVSMPSHRVGITISSARIKPTGKLEITFSNINTYTTLPPQGDYVFVLGRLSDSVRLSSIVF